MSIITNKYLYIPFVLWFSVQLFKVIYDLATTKKFNFKRIMGAGGMPSSHSAVVTSLATLIGKYEGLDTAIFAMAVVFSFIVMYDAAGVRRAAGKQAKLLNKIIETPGLSSLEVQGKLVEVLGHTPIQVMVGAAIGVLVGLVA
jgi:acid phosphatase family membrane protein YuiD